MVRGCQVFQSYSRTCVRVFAPLAQDSSALTTWNQLKQVVLRFVNCGIPRTPCISWVEPGSTCVGGGGGEWIQHKCYSCESQETLRSLGWSVKCLIYQAKGNAAASVS